jgi:uncharacterized protein YjbJ (UPF0337 family)
MNWDRVKGNWRQLQGGVQAGWGKLTDDHVAALAGRREICAGRLQEAYGIGKEASGRKADASGESIREGTNDRDTGLHRIDARQ